MTPPHSHLYASAHHRPLTVAGTACKEFMAADPVGVVPRTLKVLFSYIQAASSQMYDISLKAQYVEIYNEQICDLLASDPLPSGKSGSSKLDIRESPSGDVYVEGASEFLVETQEDVVRVLDQGNSRRTTASHK